jgi:hypothetical protein
MYIGLHVKYRCADQILMELNTRDRFSKNAQMSIFMKILSLGAELFHVVGWTDGWTEGETEGQT